MPKEKIARTQKAYQEKIIREKKSLSLGAGLNVGTIKKLFKKKEIHRIAEEVQFIRRHRKLDAYDFFCP